WVNAADTAGTSIYVRRSDNALYAFPVQEPTGGQQVRQAGSVAIWAIALVLLAMIIQSLPVIVSVLRRFPRSLDFRTRTSIYLTAVVILPLIVFVLFVRAYLANRLTAESNDRAQTALTAAQRVIEDYLASTSSPRPERVLDDDVRRRLSFAIAHVR